MSDAEERRHSCIAFIGGAKVMIHTTRAEYDAVVRRLAEDVRLTLNIATERRSLSIATANVAYIESEWFDSV